MIRIQRLIQRRGRITDTPGAIVAPLFGIMDPGDDDDEEVTEITEEEESITDEIVGHPTRDDWHEQREDGQECEAVLHAHATVVTIRVMRTSMQHSVTRR